VKHMEGNDLLLFDVLLRKLPEVTGENNEKPESV
jgi:hypothetical protein